MLTLLNCPKFLLVLGIERDLGDIALQEALSVSCFDKKYHEITNEHRVVFGETFDPFLETAGLGGS
jgi:hypothetical protein